jgi:hypothetical protein
MMTGWKHRWHTEKAKVERYHHVDGIQKWFVVQGVAKQAERCRDPLSILMQPLLLGSVSCHACFSTETL